MMESAAFGKQAQARLQLNNDRAVFLRMTWFPGDAFGKEFQSIEDHQNGRQIWRQLFVGLKRLGFPSISPESSDRKGGLTAFTGPDKAPHAYRFAEFSLPSTVMEPSADNAFTATFCGKGM
jgi:hypothetical protein